MALDDKRIIIFNKDTGDIKRNLPFSESNSRRSLAEDENLIVVPNEIKLASFPDENDTVFETTIPEDTKTEKNRVHDSNISGPIRYRSPNRTRQSADVSARLILSGQHHYATELNGNFRRTGTGGNARFQFFSLPQFEPLKLIRGDHFQIIYPGHSLLDGIYEVSGFTDKAINTVKVQGATTDGSGSSGGFYFSHGGGSGEDGYHMIRLQPYTGSAYGLSAAYEGDGIYQYNERITQSPINVYNPGVVKVVHAHDEFITGGSSALFQADPGGTGAYLVTDHISSMDPTGSGSTGDNNYFKLSLWFKFATSPKSTDKFILGQKNADGEGFYQLKYQRSPAAFVFDYSTDDTAGDFDNSLTALVPSLVSTAWNHVQVEAIPDQEVRLYLNGTLMDTDALGTNEVIFESAGGSIPFQMGADPANTLGPANAYYDDVLVQFASRTEFEANPSLQFIDGPTGSTAAVGITFGVPSFGTTTDIFTMLNFRMNGPSGGELFTEDGHEVGVVTGNMVDYDHHRRVLTVANYGITGGSTANTFDPTNGFIRGYGEGLTTGATVGITGNSEAIHPVLAAVVGITAQGANITNLKKVLIDSQDLFRERSFFATGMTGSSGGSGDFANLFGVAGASAEFGSRILTFAPTDNELLKINSAVVETSVAGVSLSAPLVFNDIDGASFAIEEQYLKAFAADVSVFRQTFDNGLSDDTATIEGSGDITDLTQDGPAKKIDLAYGQYRIFSMTAVNFPSRA